MKDPCRVCEFYKETQINEFRKLIGCIDEDKKKGFHYDSFLYWHECTNQTCRDECINCTNRNGIYCDSVYSFVEGECVDSKERKI